MASKDEKKADKKEKPRWTLAVDIERTGGFDTNDTVQLGAAVRDENCKELERYLASVYVEGEHNIEERCQVEFLDTHPEVLPACKWPGEEGIPKEIRELAMITGFHAFRVLWEEKAKEANAKLDFVSDNGAFDFGFINMLYFKHMPGTLPVWYTATVDGKTKKCEYGGTWNTHSMQRGFLMAVDSEWALTHGWGFTERIKELYEVPDDPVEHDHRADNDASTIALENAVLLGIARGTILKRKREWGMTKYDEG